MVTMKLKDCMKIETGSRNTEHKCDDGIYPFYVRSPQVERINDYHYDCEAVLTAGDGVGTGKVFHYVNGKFDAHQRVYVMSGFKNVTGKYFYYYFSKFFYGEVSKYTAKSSVDSVRRDMISEMDILVPEIEEQTAITEALSDIDEFIKSLEKYIKKKKAIKQGAMQELLTGRKRLSGFSDEWKTVKLGDVADIKDGTHQTPTYVESGIPFYSVETVSKDDFSHTKYIALAEHLRLTSSYKIEKGDVLMTRIGSLGVCKYIDWDVDASFYVSLALLKFKGNDLLAQYVSLLSDFEEFQKEIELNSLQYAIPMKINLGQISEVKMHIPSEKDEMHAIVDIIFDINSEIHHLEDKLEKYRQIKQGMMSELLTGKIRLI